jgi:hypothetical protein
MVETRDTAARAIIAMTATRRPGRRRIMADTRADIREEGVIRDMGTSSSSSTARRRIRGRIGGMITGMAVVVVIGTGTTAIPGGIS